MPEKKNVEEQQTAAKKGELHKLQKDPPEGSREVIEKQLDREEAKKPRKD
jgi:hypothetical protein